MEPVYNNDKEIRHNASESDIVPDNPTYMRDDGKDDSKDESTKRWIVKGCLD